MTEQLLDPEEVREALPEEEKEKFDTVMDNKTRFTSYILSNLEELKNEFMGVKYACDRNHARSQQQIANGTAPICRFCPAWDGYHKECRIRKHLNRMMKR